MKTTTLDEALEAIMRLDYHSREMVLEILKNRQAEEKREEIAKQARRAKTAFSKGKIKAATSEEVIKKLRTL